MDKFKGIIFVSVIIGILSFFLLRIASTYFFKGTIEKIGLTGRYHTSELPTFILEYISEGLTQLDSSLNPQPNISLSWETPDKGKTWIFNIKKGQNWHDDTEIKSTNINYEFSDVKIESLDDYSISFKLRDSYAPFPSVVSRPMFSKGLVGAGKWKVNRLSIVGSFVQEILLENTTGDKKVFKFYPTIDRTKLAYKLGEIDTIINLVNPSPFETWKTSFIEKSTNKNQVVTLFFNTQDKYLGDKAVRQALTYSINKSALGDRATSPIPPMSWAHNPQVKKYSYDTEKAKSLIDELPDETRENLEIHLITSPVLLEVAEKISKDWEIVGIKTHILVSSIIPNEFQAYLTIFDIPPDPDQYSIWHSTQTANNISGYSNARIDKLLEDGRATLEHEDRKKIYLDFQRFLLEDLPAAFLYYPNYYTVKRK